LVSVTEIVQIGDEFYRIMEYLEGENLAGLIRRLIKRRERISFGLAAHMISEICDGLNAAHVGGELHRGVSPETVFITYGGEVKLLDLGVTLADPESLYRSPEQAGSRPLGRQSDVYSIGLVLYELTTLHRVFSSSRELGEPIPPPSSQTDSYPPQLDSIVMQALARDPSQRFRSAAEMRDALLATARTLDSTGDPSQSLASKLMRLFGDRIAKKRDLLDRVRVGMPLGDLVPTDADEEIEVPGIQRDTRRSKTPICVHRSSRTSRGSRASNKSPSRMTSSSPVSRGRADRRSRSRPRTPEYSSKQSHRSEIRCRRMRCRQRSRAACAGSCGCCS
jgi:serine/threonine protein kinase